MAVRELSSTIDNKRRARSVIVYFVGEQFLMVMVELNLISFPPPIREIRVRWQR